MKMEGVAAKKFQSIFESSGFQSLEEADLACLQSYSELMKLVPQKSSRLGVCLCAILGIALLAVILPVAALALVHHGYFSDVQFLQSLHRESSRWVMEEYIGISFEEESCLLETLEPVENMFRPPVDCAICRNITKVQRVSDISREEFEERFAYSGRPAVITDAMSDWTAQETFSYEYLKAVYYNESLALEGPPPPDAECQFFPYQTHFDSLKDVFTMSSERARLEDGSKPWYIGWSNCHSLVANTLRQHYHQLYFLPSESESSRTDWIFMGAPGYGAPMHIDNVGLPSWQAQIKGTKRWILEPPPECYLECWDTGILEVVVHPGEIIVLDTNRWFHQTLIEGDDLSITIGSEYD